jgi:hypothetical protein
MNVSCPKPQACGLRPVLQNYTVVVSPRHNCFVEDSRIAGYTMHTILFHQSLKLTARDRPGSF